VADSKKTIKRLGVLTSGGDCAGLNAVIRAIAYRAIQHYDCEVFGIQDGTHGLMDRPIRYEELDLQMFSGTLLRTGGTILGTTTKGDPFHYPMPDGSFKNRSDEIVEGLQELGLDGLIGIGGDGSLDILHRLIKDADIPFIGIPKTIDNDVPKTEFAVGFSTAVSIAVEALDRLQPTADSHDRIMILEVMGRDAGHIALNAGIAGGADVILIPEIEYDLNIIADHIKSLHARGRNHALMVCSEAARSKEGEVFQQTGADGKKRYGGVGHVLGNRLAEMTGEEIRVTVLGHVQRGGVPSAQDRILASAFGVRAVDMIMKGETAKMVAWQHRQVVAVDLEEVVAQAREVRPSETLVQTARGLGICLGD
jgi:phosphofructokinase-like protein